MGRGNTAPEVEDSYTDFRISRVRDPDDEFATKQYLTEDFVFVDLDELGDGRMPWRTNSLATATDVLAAYKAGVESVHIYFD